MLSSYVSGCWPFSPRYSRSGRCGRIGGLKCNAQVTRWKTSLEVGNLRPAAGLDNCVWVWRDSTNLAAIEGMHAKARDPVRRAKIAAAKLGKPRPPEVIEALRRANLGKKLSAATRAKMSAAHKARGTWPPAAGKALSARELRLIRELPPAEAAKRTGRTLSAVYSQRSRLGCSRLCADSMRQQAVKQGH